jgi:hypothetical protein
VLRLPSSELKVWVRSGFSGGFLIDDANSIKRSLASLGLSGHNDKGNLAISDPFICYLRTSIRISNMSRRQAVISIRTPLRAIPTASMLQKLHPGMVELIFATLLVPRSDLLCTEL